MNISDVAKKTGLTSKAIRFYEEKKLVTPPVRTDNGYRSYTAKHIEELTLLRQARQVGLHWMSVVNCWHYFITQHGTARM